MFDTSGNLVGSINNLDLPANPVLTGLNPNTRTAFAAMSNRVGIQSFSY